MAPWNYRLSCLIHASKTNEREKEPEEIRCTGYMRIQNVKDIWVTIKLSTEGFVRTFPTAEFPL